MADKLLPVALLKCASYEASCVRENVFQVLEASGFAPSRGSVVLVKPNLLRAHPLTCTHPEIVGAACQWLLERGVRVRVGESPGFGTAVGVARFLGLDAVLKPLGLAVQALGNGVRVPLSQGGSWPVARLALEADVILSVPKVKAHAQLGMSLAVKNVFGCVPGLAKAIAHTRQGHHPGVFVDALVDLLQALPPVAGLADGITAMHVTGPSNGKAFALGCVGASCSAVALDTVLYQMVGATPQIAPLWGALQVRGIAGALPAATHVVLDAPESFATHGFQLPDELMDISFRPQRLVWSLMRRLWLGWNRP